MTSTQQQTASSSLSSQQQQQQSQQQQQQSQQQSQSSFHRTTSTINSTNNTNQTRNRPSSRPKTSTSLQSSKESIKLSIQLDDNQTIEIMSSGSNLDESGANAPAPAAFTAQNNGSGLAGYDTSNLTDEELAKKAQEELNMEGEMEEVRLFFTVCSGNGE